MKYRIVDADNRAEYSKPKTFEEVKAWFEPNAELEEEHNKWAEIQDIDEDKLKEILDNPENLLYTGSMVSGLQFTTPRYSYIKHLEFDGKEYEAEIDELERKFCLFEIED